jgi:hypothetical protein
MVFCLIGCSPCWICVCLIDLLPLPAAFACSLQRRSFTPNTKSPSRGSCYQPGGEPSDDSENYGVAGHSGCQRLVQVGQPTPRRFGLVSGHSSVVTSPSGDCVHMLSTCFRSSSATTSSSQSSQRLPKPSAVRNPVRCKYRNALKTKPFRSHRRAEDPVLGREEIGGNRGR